MPLLTLVELKSFLGVTGTSQDARLDLFRQAMEAAFLSAVGREIESARRTEKYNAYGVDSLTLRNYPVTTIHSVTIRYPGIADTILEADEYEVNEGILYLRYQPYRKWSVFPARWYRQMQGVNIGLTTNNLGVVVDYTAGYDPVPGDIKAAIAEAVASKKSATPIGGMLSSEGYEDYSYSLQPLAVESEMLRLGSVAETITRYRSTGAIIA